jgi:hypothetical protein
MRVGVCVQIRSYDQCTDFDACEGRDTVINTPAESVWCQPPADLRSRGGGQRSAPDAGRSLNRRISQCSVTRQGLQARLLAQVANKLAKKTQQPGEALRDDGGAERQRGVMSNENIRLEEAQTRRFLGRIRSAVATAPDSAMQPEDGETVWREKDAIAHSLYSRRLQMVEGEVASLRADKEHLARVIKNLQSTNEQLERDVVHQLPALVNKTFALEHNLLLRGKEAAGLWLEEPADAGKAEPEKAASSAVQGYTFGYTGCHGRDDEARQWAGEVQKLVPQQVPAVCSYVQEVHVEKARKAEPRKDGVSRDTCHTRVLVAGPHRLRAASLAPSRHLAEAEEIVSLCLSLCCCQRERAVECVLNVSGM